MATLTPLSIRLIRGLVIVAVLGAMGSAAWHLALKDRFSGNAEVPQSSVSQPTAEPLPSAPGQGPSVVTTPSTAPEAPPSPSLAQRPTPPEPEPAVVQPLPEPSSSSSMTAAQHAERGRQLVERKRFEEARPHLETAIEQGDGGSACHLGDMFLKGQGGLVPSPGQAARLYQLAQSRGIICFSAGS